jgi:hypothetical protein
MYRRKKSRLWVLILILVLVGGWFWLNEQTSSDFETICSEAGWKATLQTESATGNPATLCWKAEEPTAVPKGDFRYDCEDGNELVYYYVNRDIEILKSDMGSELFNYISTNCEYIGD